VITRSSVCADASLLVKLALIESDSSSAQEIWESWVVRGVNVFAPRLIMYEFVSVVRQAIRRRTSSDEMAALAIDKLMNLELTVIDWDDLHKAALDLANALDIPSAYDAHYLALASALDCEFWTADRRLFASVSDRFPLIRLLGA
jgi:predicted nucleic acid-binding protein